MLLVLKNTSTIDKKNNGNDASKTLKAKLPLAPGDTMVFRNRLDEIMGPHGALYWRWFVPISFQSNVNVEMELNQNYV